MRNLLATDCYLEWFLVQRGQRIGSWESIAQKSDDRYVTWNNLSKLFLIRHCNSLKLVQKLACKNCAENRLCTHVTWHQLLGNIVVLKTIVANHPMSHHHGSILSAISAPPDWPYCPNKLQMTDAVLVALWWMFKSSFWACDQYESDGALISCGYVYFIVQSGSLQYRQS